jgi:hypothetical protein
MNKKEEQEIAILNEILEQLKRIADSLESSNLNKKDPTFIPYYDTKNR